MDEPVRIIAAPIFVQAFAVKPDAAPCLILNLEVIA
jgi:hypothetical protein